MNLPSDKYTSSDYVDHNPTWDCEDSPWKARLVKNIINKAQIEPGSICDVGCGAGGVLAQLRKYYSEAELHGYEIAPDAAQFWREYEQLDINFSVADISVLNNKKFDVILLLDVIEHVNDPHDFLLRVRSKANFFVFHIPLDLSAITVLREHTLLEARNIKGHIHYFTKNLALSLLRECGFDVMQWEYSRAAANAPKRSWQAVLASYPRRLLHAVAGDWGVRALGGETLIVLARNNDFIKR